MSMTSNRSYLLKAIRDWIVDNEKTPHLVVDSTMEGVKVPVEHLSDDSQIILDVSPAMVRNFELKTQILTFDAAFPGVIYHLIVPLHAVLAIFCKENGQGIVFDDEEAGLSGAEHTIEGEAGSTTLKSIQGGAEKPKKKKAKKKNGHLKIIK